MVLPADGAPHGAWVCAGAGSVTLQGFAPPMASQSVAFSWTEVHAAGSCPGMPVSGTLVWSNETGLTGTAGSVTAPGWTGTAVGTQEVPGNQRVSLPECGVLEMDTLVSPAGGFLITPGSGNADPGALYCIGSVTPQPNGDLVLGDLSRFGRCDELPAATGGLAVCASP